VTVIKESRFKMRRVALMMAVAMASGRAYALGLGDIELHSALNRPLNAEIPLLVENPKELDSASVLLAPNDEFVRAGIDRPAILSDLKFNIVTDKNGSVVKITSTQPIREPFLDFVVQLRWPSGRLLREYTVLLDPPVFGEEQHGAAVTPPAAAPAVMTPPAQPAAPATPVNATTTTSAPAAATPTESAAPAPAPRRARRSSAPIHGGGESATASKPASAPPAASTGAHSYGPTKRNDTLWNIANEVKPDDSVSVYQMMLALLKENPEAFYNDNINELKAGYVLRVPDKATAAAISQQRAVQEAARQYQRWQQARRGIAVPPESPPAEQTATAAAAPAAATEDKDKETARLRLVAPSDSHGGDTAGGMKAELDKLRGDLALAMESSDTAKRESDELRSRVAALEDQINSMQRLLTLKDQALSDMQKRSGLEVPASAQTQTAVAAQSAPPPAAVPPAKPKPMPAPPPADQAPSLSDNPALVGAAGGAALLLLSVGWLMVRRRRDNQAEGEVMFEPVMRDEPSPPYNIRPADAAPAAPAVDEVHDDLVNDEPRMNQMAEEIAQQAEQNITQTASDLDVMSTPEGDIDPIVEADVYLAYRRYQQAETLVQNALSKQPDRQDLQAKLLEIYYAAKDGEAFRKVAESLYIHLGSNEQDPLWQRILPMGRELCPDHELFAAHDDPAEEASDLDEAADMPHEVMTPAEEKMEFDLDLEGDATGTSALAAGEAPAEAEREAANWEAETAGSDFGNLDFGLDDGDLLAGTDVVGTKLDLARAYIDMGDNDSARDILKEVTEEGNDQQKQEAQSLMEKIA
jgi:pilus assembly protein FimV